jgi:RNA polymerase sigma-70 factor (ECF subfamily)
LNETDLIRRAQAGDGAAWEALVQTHQQAVFRLAYLFLGDADQAEDVAQDAFIRAYHALSRFDISRPFRPWLMSIAANLARNQRRSAGRYLAAMRRAFQDSPSPTIDIEASAAQNWEAQSLWQAVRRLSYEDQQVIYFRYFIELSVDETAAALGVPEGTVKSRLHRALNRLRALIDREYPSIKEGRLL